MQHFVRSEMLNKKEIPEHFGKMEDYKFLKIK